MDIITDILSLIEQLELWFYALIIFLCFFESTAFIGTLLPGGILIIAIGFLSSFTPLSIWLFILCAAIGAMGGDIFSYWLGTKGINWFKHERALLTIGHLDKARSFFSSHGDKSIFLGRFIGFMRPIIPFVAGLSRMSLKKFLFWSTVSAFLWAISHILLGYIFGHFFEEFSIPKSAWVFCIAIPFVIVTIWVAMERKKKILS